MRCSINLLCVLVVIFVFNQASDAHAQAYKTAVGYNDLVAEKGAALEDGTGLSVVLVEAPGSVGNYAPDENNAEFNGSDAGSTDDDKKFIDATNAGTGTSSHATGVGRFFFGDVTSMTQNIGLCDDLSMDCPITFYDANDYINNALGHAGGGDPLAQGFSVGNHSYIGNGVEDPVATDILERFDFVINRDNTVMVVGANNGTGATPDLLAPSYNAITVGRTDGNHSRGAVSGTYGNGRLRPDIVAPASATSFATPIVSSAAALLRDAAEGTNGIQNEVIKSTLFAGATKSEFGGWDRTTTRPIDEVFGFGELNILNSYHIWEGGENEGSITDPAANISRNGWDYGDFNGTDDLFYDFEIGEFEQVTELSAALVWNIDVVDNDGTEAVFDASTFLANLDLQLFDSTGTFLGTLIDSSLSTEYNTEHIYLKHLTSGNYTFQISGDAATDFGFSWRISTVPEPSSLVVLGLIGVTALSRRRRS
ncbi:MAG: S8 family serine peptidase [Mariniblastus sp.]